MHNIESCKLCSGVFWVITDSGDINDYMLLVFEIPCDPYGNIKGTQKVPLNSKSKNTYNHKRLWEAEVQDKPIHKLIIYHNVVEVENAHIGHLPIMAMPISEALIH